MQQRTWMQGMLLVGLALAQGGATARADYTTAPQTFTIPLTKTNWTPTTSTLTGVDPLSVVKFDPTTLGLPPGQTAILTQVDLTVNYTFENTLTMRFDNPSTITVSASGTMNLYLPNGTTNLVTPPTFTNSSTQTATVSDTFSKYVTLPTQTTTGTASQSYVDQPTVSQFLYNGSNGKLINLPVFAQAQSSFATNSGNGFGSSVTLAGASITVVYHYILPEPSSFVLTGLGVMGLGTIVVKRSRVGLKKSGTV